MTMIDNSDFTSHLSLELRRVWESIQPVDVPPVPNADEVWQVVSGSAFASGKSRMNSWNRWAAGISAVAAIAVICIVGIKYIANRDVTHQLSSLTQTYKTRPGQRVSITLADGSQATLAPATTLRIIGRTVDLSGEAIFTVAHKEGLPFIVTAKGTQTRVLGTTFGVRAYAEDKAVRVAVAEGKVSVNTSALIAGDAVTVTKTGMSMQHEANIANLFAWTSGRLVFDKIPLRDVIPELERWYDIKVSADKELLNRPVVTAFQTETASEAIQLLAITLGAQGTLNGKHANFTAN